MKENESEYIEQMINLINKMTNASALTFCMTTNITIFKAAGLSLEHFLTVNKNMWEEFPKTKRET